MTWKDRVAVDTGLEFNVWFRFLTVLNHSSPDHTTISPFAPVSLPPFPEQGDRLSLTIVFGIGSQVLQGRSKEKAALNNELVLSCIIFGVKRIADFP